MPPLDHATLQAVLDKQGMPNTTENLNRIAQFAAVAPDMLDKYLGRGTDQARADQGAGAAIDRSIASTSGGAVDPRLAQLAGPNPYTATLDPSTGMTNIGPGLVKTPEPTGGGARGPAKPPSIQGDLNAPVGAPPFQQAPAPAPQAQGNNLDYLLPSLLPALKYLADKSGINAGGPSRAPAPAVPEPVGPWGPRQPAPGGPWEGTPAPRPQASAEPTPRAPAPYGSDIQRPNVQAPTQGSPAVPLSDPDRSSPAGRPSGQSQADIEKLRAEAAAEREAAAGAEEAKARKLRGEMNARETLKAAGRAVGRK